MHIYHEYLSIDLNSYKYISPKNLNMNINIYLYMYMYMDRDICMYIHTFIPVYVYICILVWAIMCDYRYCVSGCAIRV